MPHSIEIAIQVCLLLAGVGAAGWWFFKGSDTAEADKQRGYDDASAFYKKGVSVWSMKGFVDTQRARGQAGPYEAGMVKFFNEITRVGQ
jgi:hypothetical protein